MDNLSNFLIREEWLHVFGINAASDEMARFLTLLSHIDDRSEIPTARELRRGVEKDESLTNRIRVLESQIQDLDNQKNAVPAPQECQWQYVGSDLKKVC